MDVIADHLEIDFIVRIDQQGFVTPLEQMATFMMPSIKPMCIGALEPLHTHRQIGFRRLNETMSMIDHQGVRMNDPTGTITSLSQGLKKQFAIVAITKYLTLTIATTHHVINRTCIFNSWFSRHEPQIIEGQKTCQRLFPRTPIPASHYASLFNETSLSTFLEWLDHE